MRVLSDGHSFTEGPVVLLDGSIAFVDAEAGLYRIKEAGQAELMTSLDGSANGLAVEADGSIVIANNGGIGRPSKIPGSIQRWRDGVTETLVPSLDAPNDICVDNEGAVWFTDPRDNYFLEDLPPGRIYRLEDSLELVHEGLQYPNGIGFDPAGTLYIAETKTGTIYAMEKNEPAAWTKVPEGAPDGFTFDRDGTCFVCCFDVGKVFVIERSGATADLIDIGPDTWPTNCTIAPDGALIVTEGKQGRVLAFDLGLERI